MLFLKLQIIFYHHLISHIDNAVQDEVTVISSEWLGGGGHKEVTSCCIVKASVWPVCSAGPIFTEV